MATTPLILAVTPDGFVASLTEDNGVAGDNTWNCLAAYLAAGGLATSPFYTLFATAHANQAAARVFLEQFGRVSLVYDGATPPVVGVSGFAQMKVDSNIVGGVVAGNFRLVVGCVKSGDADTGVWRLVVEYRHSITQ